AAYLPLDHGHPPERLALLLRDARPTVLLTTARHQPALPPDAPPVVRLDADAAALARHSTATPGSGVGPGGLADGLDTSGATGQLKGVMVPHRGVVNYLCWARQAYAVEQGSGAPVHSPVGFDLTVTSLFGPLVAGRPVVLLPEEQGVEALTRVLRQGQDF